MSKPETPVEFTKSRTGVEASIMPIGLNTTQVILIAEDGEWLRFVVGNTDAAKIMCERLSIDAHDGFPEHLRQRMGSYKREASDWSQAPYPERRRGSST